MTTISDPSVDHIRSASRRLVRELGFMRSTLAGTTLPPSAVHALVEIGRAGALTAVELTGHLLLERSSVSRMVRKLIDAGEIREGASETDARIKPLSLTAKGQATLARIDGFATRQVEDAMHRIPPGQHRTVIDGLRLYADALGARTGAARAEAEPVTIEATLRPGVVARCVEMHALHYARTVGFGLAFEAQVAGGLAEFSQRLNRPVNRIWHARQDGRVVGTIAIDGEDLGQGRAHLRWFIVDGAVHGGGIGRRLLAEALAFCQAQGFAETHLWTFRGLDAARRLYEANGFRLVDERAGSRWGDTVAEQQFVLDCAVGKARETSATG